MARAKTARSKKNGNATNGNDTTSNPISELQGAPLLNAQATTEARVQSTSDGRRNIVPINLEEEIRRRAYEIYQERGGIPGDENDDWLRAEREILARYQQTA
jgi:Protein of unknown function (DUF2934)